ERARRAADSPDGLIVTAAGTWSMDRPSSTASARSPHNGPGGVRSQELSAASPGNTATKTTRGKNIADRCAGAINGCALIGTATESRASPPASSRACGDRPGSIVLVDS